MGLDGERILSKIAFIKEQLQSIRMLTEVKSKNEIIYDQWLLKGLKYSLQTAIEAMIDIIYHITAKRFAHAPVDARDALRILRQNNIIGQQDFETFTSMIGFRNKVVHGYQEILPERVYEISTAELGDFNRFINIILEWLPEEG